MLLASIIILCSGLALSLLVLLDRHETAIDRAYVIRRTAQRSPLAYYDAFSDRRKQPAGTPRPGSPDQRRSAA